MTFRVRTLRRANADILSITDYIYEVDEDLQPQEGDKDWDGERL